MAKDVDMDALARCTPGFSGAELYNLVNQAALKASVDGLRQVSMHALNYAKDKIMMGAEKTSAVITPGSAVLSVLCLLIITTVLTIRDDEVHCNPRGWSCLGGHKD